MESFPVGQLDEALEFIKNKVTLTPGAIYQTCGFVANMKKEEIEAKLNIRYVYSRRCV